MVAENKKRRIQTLSLRTVLTVPYVSLVVFLAASLGFLSYTAGSRAVLTVSEHLLNETVSRIGQAVDRHVVGSVATLETAFPEGIYAPVDIETDFDSMRTRFWVATSLHIDPNNFVYYGNVAGQAFGLYRHSYEIGELRLKFRPEDHRRRYRIVGISGTPEYDSTEKALFDPRQRPWFTAAATATSDIWTSVYIDFGTRDLVATRARRVLGKCGEFQGVVATDMPLRALNDFVSTLHISPNGLAFILEPNGDLIASSQSPNVRDLGDGQTVRINAAESGHPLLTEIYQQLLPKLKGDLTPGAAHTFFFNDSRGEKIHVAFELFTDSAGLKWVNVVALPSRDFMGGISTNVMRTSMLGGVATIIVILLGFRILHWVTVDIKKLSVAVQRVGSGHPEHPISIRRNDEIGDLAKSFQAMCYRLQTDHLTGLPNRYAFERAIDAAIERQRRVGNEQGVAVLFIDINDFKNINDQFGHDAGDRALIELALRLRTHVRKEDLVARYAGDEFVVLMENVGEDEDLETIRRHIEEVLQASLRTIDNRTISVSGAIGIARYPADAENLKDLVHIADQRMYRHKEKARG